MRNCRVAGVVTTDRDIEGETVISKVDSWTLKVIENVGLRLPIETFIDQRYLTQSFPSPLIFPAVLSLVN